MVQPGHGLITVFARYEPTQDQTTKAIWPNTQKRDVMVYRDVECTKLMGRFPWFASCKPRKNSQVLTLNCWQWRIQWQPELGAVITN